MLAAFITERYCLFRRLGGNLDVRGAGVRAKRESSCLSKSTPDSVDKKRTMSVVKTLATFRLISTDQKLFFFPELWNWIRRFCRHIAFSSPYLEKPFLRPPPANAAPTRPTTNHSAPVIVVHPNDRPSHGVALSNLAFSVHVTYLIIIQLVLKPEIVRMTPCDRIAI